VRRGFRAFPCDEGQSIAHVVERVEHWEVALARNRERVRRALREEVRDEDFATGAGGSHDEALAARRARSRHSI
jgi:hypothetical protein